MDFPKVVHVSHWNGIVSFKDDVYHICQLQYFARITTQGWYVLELPLKKDVLQILSNPQTIFV